MGFAKLIETLNTLPPEKQSEIIDFAEFIAKKHQQTPQNEEMVTPLAEWLLFPKISAFEPMGREEANAR
jgi:hypothetical protein